MNSQCLDFRTLPGQNELFLTYLHDFERVTSLYLPFPLQPDELDKRAESVLEARHFSRQVLVAVLRELNGRLNGYEALDRSLSKLESMDTLAVLTGQQVGLFGGPAYSVYKAATAIQAARHLESKGYSAVPVFWLAADDSDFAEVRTVRFFDNEDSLITLRHPDQRINSRQMVGTVTISPSTLGEFVSRLRGATALEPIIRLIETSYASGSTFRTGFASWISKLFGEYGLVLFDPLAEGYRGHLKDFFMTAVRQREELVTTVRQRSDELKKAGLPVQVRVEETETFLFLFEPPNRFKLEFRNGYYEAKGRRSFRVRPTELQRRIEEDEIALGVNVLLRPILQEYLFPTLGSVMGPAEIAYLSQVNALARYWNQEIAAIPRASFTLVDRKAQRILKKYDLEAEEILKLPSLQLAAKVLKQGKTAGILDDFDTLRRDLSEHVRGLQEKIAVQDPTTAQLLEGVSRKMYYQIDKVYRRFVLNQNRHEGDREKHLTYLTEHLLPRGSLQERVLNFNGFLAREGRGLIDELINRIDPENISHQLLYL